MDTTKWIQCYLHATQGVVEVGSGDSLTNLQRKVASCDALKNSVTLLQAVS